MAQEKHDLQLEDVQDYTSDYPPDYPGAEGAETKRRGLLCGLIMGNKKMTCLLALVFILVIAIVTILVVGADENAIEGFHQPLIIIDPSTLDASVTGPLMASLLAMYDRNGMDSTPLDPSSGDNTPQRRAFFWLAHENQNLDHSTKMARYALAVLYYSTNQVPTEFDEEPETWYVARRWLTKASYCEWHGIVCDAQGRVEALEMDRNFLTGVLPIELRILEDTLYSIDVADNGISMSEEDFDVFLNLVNLEEFFGDNNYLEYSEGLPPQMASLVNLEQLTMSYNLLGGELSADSVIPAMGQLTHIEMEANYFSGSIPDYIGEMEDLVYFYMRRNNFNGDLSFLEGGAMTTLFAMWLDGNDLTGTIPAQVGSLQNLASLSVSNTKLKGPIPAEIGDLLKLRRVWMYDNQLTGEIPLSLQKLDKLEVLELHNNNMSGSMPQGICDIFAGVDYDFKALTADCNGAVSCSRSCCTKCY
eukprot:CAMPEP_0113642816 /NCGR_PEP_ID=MMETSP0017_2-20120614/22496_1 /TAXON_ID=2856 /ORGANISM="Cylindrotheca closterium" /LENGTH=473 /DNA_ID=CAMNT_0000554265 /DNA_START=22 /DNA_END=1443 /DNA_ORIENTATION=- /assembly_acc=CAM_ASM_000147